LYYLKENGYKDNLNFWRKDQRQLKLTNNDNFYFKLRGHKYIAGRARFGEQINLTIEEAWNKYGERNGVPSLSEFRNKVKALFKDDFSHGSKLNCLILNNADWLQEPDYYFVSSEFFPPNILGAKYYSDSEISIVAKNFGLYNNQITNYGDRKFLENSIKMSKHKSRERDANLVKLVKSSRSWECEICGIFFEDRYGIAYIEAHHKVPLNHLDSIVFSGVNDIALLCPNCHKAVHKYMEEYQAKPYEQVREELSSRL